MRLAVGRSVTAIALTALMSLANPASAITSLTLDLVNGSIVGTDLMVDVVGRYDDGGDPTADLVEFQIDVSDSSANLTAGGTDYSRFTFNLSPNAPFDQWEQVSQFAEFPLGTPDPASSRAAYHDDFGIAPPLDDTGGAFVLLGTIVVDLTGLPGGQESVVDIGFIDPIGTYGSVSDLQLVVVDVDDVDVHSGDAGGNEGQFTFNTPGDDTGGFAIPEPATAALAIVGLAGLAIRRTRRPAV